MPPIPSWPPQFDAAIFDFDGTIANTSWIWEEVDRAFLGARGIAYTTEYARMLTLLGFSSGAQYTIETYHLKEDPEDICEEWRRLSSALYRTKVTLRAGAEDYLRELRARGVKTALATSNEPDLIASMEHVDVEGLFDVRLHSRDVGTTKDQPDIYLEAARRLGTEPARCMVFEDIAPGLRSAHEAGFMTCAVKSDETAQLVEEVRDAAEFFLEDWTVLVPSGS